jgi:AcrR family transcriptional regulator
MPRKQEPQLRARILQAALQLFVKGGEKNLSMRTLAKLARTNTPAVYRRFRNRDAVLRALAEHFRRNYYTALEPCRSHEEMCQAMLERAVRRPREYELFFSELVSKVPGPRPNFEFAKERAAEWLGGSPEDHVEMTLALFALIHGTAMLLISGAVAPENQARLRATFTATVRILVRNAASLR